MGITTLYFLRLGIGNYNIWEEYTTAQVLNAKYTSIIGDSSAHKLCLKLCERISWKNILSHLELQNSFYVKTFQGAQNTAALCGTEWGLCFWRGIYNSVCLVMQQIKVDLHFIINFLFILRTAQATLLALRQLSVLDL